MEVKKDSIINKLAEFAIEAMLYEVSAYPTPGLVSPISSGAHKDMSYNTFLDSISCLSSYMYEFAEAGFNNNQPKEIFKNIRSIGIKAEEAMLKKTRGVNTHKGMIFLMGISVSATSKVIYEDLGFKKIRNIIKEMTKDIVKNELHKNNNKNPTYGETIFLKYGLEGVRGEAERGLPIVFDYALPVYFASNDLEERFRLVHTLLYIMCYCEDTTILHRHDINELYYVQKKSKDIIEIGGVRTIEGLDAIFKLDKKFSKDGISPGGSADLLAITVFFYFVNDFLEKGVLYEKF